MLQFNATLLFVMISFIIFMILMKIVYFDPILKIRAERERKLTEDQDAARRFLKDYERLYAEYEASLHHARKEAHALIQELRTQAKANAQQTLQIARREAQAESDRQMAELGQWRETTYRQLGNERDGLTQVIISKVTHTQKVQTVTGG